LFLLNACEPTQHQHVLTGQTMGTTYSITLATTEEPPHALQEHIKNRLLSLNRQMSTYLDDSEISRFNNSRGTEWYTLSSDFAAVMKHATEISQLSDGAFDPGLESLIDLWGFGDQFSEQKIPPPETIETLLKSYKKPAFELQDRRLRKLDPSFELNLSAIAKGYAVDVLADIVAQSGYENYLIEIGGEVRARGTRPDGKIWKVAIQQPDNQAGDINRIISLNNQSIATSGDYRNYFEVDGIRYSHVIDPSTGYPPDNNIASVTVLAENCIHADALATALMVMGKERGLEFAQREELAVQFILRKEDSYEAFTSPAFQYFIQPN